MHCGRLGNPASFHTDSTAAGGVHGPIHCLQTRMLAVADVPRCSFGIGSILLLDHTHSLPSTTCCVFHCTATSWYCPLLLIALCIPLCSWSQPSQGCWPFPASHHSTWIFWREGCSFFLLLLTPCVARQCTLGTVSPSAINLHSQLPLPVTVQLRFRNCFVLGLVLGLMHKHKGRCRRAPPFSHLNIIGRAGCGNLLLLAPRAAG